MVGISKTESVVYVGVIGDKQITGMLRDIPSVDTWWAEQVGARVAYYRDHGEEAKAERCVSEAEENGGIITIVTPKESL
jgi:hypothetical protein